MPKQLLFYERARPISKQAHRDARVAAKRDFNFAAEASAAPIVVAEFAAVAREFPIVFMNVGGAVAPAVMLGLRDHESLMVNPDGSWAARYVPAFIRRYPFVVSRVADSEEFVVCVDEAALGDKGERLFDDRGDQTEFLKKQMEFLSDYQRQSALTLRFCARLKELDLLTPMSARFSDASGAEGTTGGFSAVSREKLSSLSDADALAFFGSGWLELVDLHLHSLGAVEALKQRLSRADDARKGKLH